MSEIMTPVSLWSDFDSSLQVMPVTLGEKEDDGIKFEYIYFSGRDTGMGRVTVYAVIASSIANPARAGLLVMPESGKDIDENLLKFFVERGYTVCCVDYSGRREGAERFTLYPQNVEYANLAICGRSKDYADEGAKKTCWYEWVSVGVYARKMLLEKLNGQNIGLIGIRDGGEIAWKLATVAQFACAVTVSACGWRAYEGYSKFLGKEPEFDEERYRYIAGVESQSYAPYVKCPMLLLCTMNDPAFDYDRAYDTFSRINPKFIGSSVISYSVKCDARVDGGSTHDMLMFLDSFVKGRYIFVPKPAEVTIEADENDNLIARVTYDNMGILDKCGVFFAQDCLDSSCRDWSEAPLKRVVGSHESEYYLNVYEKTGMVFALCYCVYSNGFTVWSRLAVKRIKGKFRNSCAKCKIMYTNKFGEDCFISSDCSKYAIGGIFLDDEQTTPRVVTAMGLNGIYSKCGLRTNRLLCPQYAPDKDSILKFDVCPAEDSVIELILEVGEHAEIYTAKLYVLGGVWQSVMQKAKIFKNKLGISLENFTGCTSFTVTGDVEYALNNLIWL